MSKKLKRQNLNPPRKCIFCGDGNLSREHFWPKWAAELLPKYSQEQYTEQLYTFVKKTFLVGPPQTRTKNGYAWTKRIRVVCKTCNETWMSQLENKVKGIITPLIISTSHTISENAVNIITQWITLKVMISEHNIRDDPGNVVTTQEMRLRFKDTLEVPTNLKIWIARCGMDGWKSGFRRDAATVSLTPTPAPSDQFKNIQSITFGIGDLLIHVLHITAENVNLDYAIGDSNAIAQLYPFSRVIDWPLNRVLTVAEANYLSGTLDRTFKSPQVLWRPLPTIFST